MRIFITGSTGFVGRHVSRLLVQRGHELMLLVRDREPGRETYFGLEHVSLVCGDLSNIEEWKGELAGFVPDAVVHLAWEGLPDYSEEMCERNLKYGRELFLSAAQAGCKCILAAGSCWEYKGRQGMLNEESELELSECFAAAKNSLRVFGEEICREYGISFYWPRLFYVYGPGQRNTSLVPHIIDSFQDGVEPAIKNPGNRNDFVYVKDVAEAIACLIEKRPDKMVYNIGSGHSTSVRDVVSIVSEIMRCQHLYSQMNDMLLQQAGEEYWADISHAMDDLEWSPAYSIRDGIQELLEHFCKGKCFLEN